jgi:two-component system, OmpR family, sensor histidine kinase SenX3
LAARCWDDVHPYAYDFRVSVVSALTVTGISALLALALGLAIGVAVIPRFRARRRQAAAEQSGLTVFQMLSDIIDRAPFGVVVVDNFRDVVFTNDRARELGLVPDRLLDDRVWVAAQRTLMTGHDRYVDLVQRHPGTSGRTTLSVRVHVRLLSHDDTRFAVLYVDDQSEQARMEATRRDFVANVSHELKTPVAAMGVLAEALLESADDPDTVHRFGGKVLAESKRLGSMVGELIELSRLQGAERLPDLDSVDVDTVVAEAISRYKVAADNADIRVAADPPSGLEMLGDQPLLVTALANLVANAIAYSPHGSTVSVSRRRVGDNIEIAVTDRGIGIAPADQERVFERFFRVDKARTRATGGTGLGLAIVKHVAANHNGSIRLWSKLGTGSTFTLSIPARTEAEGPTPAVSPTAPPVHFSRAARRPRPRGTNMPMTPADDDAERGTSDEEESR